MATDICKPKAFPTFLYYNPHAQEKSVRVDLGADAVDLYEMISEKVIRKNVAGPVDLQIKADEAIILVRLPPNSGLAKKGRGTATHV